MRPDSSGIETFTCLDILINLLTKRTLKASFFSRKPLETEKFSWKSGCDYGCCLVRQSNNLNNSSKDCHWLILACFNGEQSTADATFTHLEKKVRFENSADGMRVEVIVFFIKKQIKIPRLCSVLTRSCVFPHSSFVLYRFLRALQQNRAQWRLLYLLCRAKYKIVSPCRARSGLSNLLKFISHTWTERKPRDPGGWVTSTSPSLYYGGGVKALPTKF